ncbi:hypothetical protein GCM10028857_15970 [Salinarchaeum chitinilyticum]
MPVSPDRKLDVLGVVLAVLVVLGAGLAVFGAMEASSGGGGEEIEIDFTVERINETHLRVVHAGGDVVEGADLSITIDGRDRVPVGRFPERVNEGDAAVVQIDAGHTLRVYYHGGLGAPSRLDSADT